MFDFLEFFAGFFVGISPLFPDGTEGAGIGDQAQGRARDLLLNLVLQLQLRDGLLLERRGGGLKKNS